MFLIGNKNLIRVKNMSYEQFYGYSKLLSGYSYQKMSKILFFVKKYNQKNIYKHG